MKEEFLEYIRRASRNRKICIWGTGKKADEAFEIADNAGIEISAFVDNDENKWHKVFHDHVVLPPAEVSGDWYILIGVGYSPHIISQLKDMGFAEGKDFIAILEQDFYEAVNRYKEAPGVPDINAEVLENITNEIIQRYPYKYITWFDEEKFNEFEDKFDAGILYNKKHSRRYRRKLMEHFCAYQLLKRMKWDEHSIFIDMAGGSSPFAKFLREHEDIRAYSIDISASRYNYLNYYIQGDASSTDFEDSSVTAVSIQSSFETFPGDLDIRIVKEISRILKVGGKAFICPLYLHEKQLSMVSPSNYMTGLADSNSLEVIRTDCRDALPMSRYYSVAGLEERLLGRAEQWGLSFKIHILPDEIVEKDGFVYFKYILELLKS